MKRSIAERFANKATRTSATTMGWATGRARSRSDSRDKIVIGEISAPNVRITARSGLRIAPRGTSIRNASAFAVE
ncbi:MAG TPA: hypothetical protein DCS07_01840 [Bdellovibrionales bacterium]|nr:hypothetical protein [Bdellovibrionales bacterium]